MQPLPRPVVLNWKKEKQHIKGKLNYRACEGARVHLYAKNTSTTIAAGSTTVEDLVKEIKLSKDSLEWTNEPTFSIGLFLPPAKVGKFYVQVRKGELKSEEVEILD